MFTSGEIGAEGRSWASDHVWLWARRTADELHVHVRTRRDGDTPFDEAVAPGEPPTVRFAILPTSTVTFCIRAADRPMVVRPEHPLVLVPGASARIYVSLPVWMGVAVDEAVVMERPSRPVRSTWFGATPQAGELAYASLTSARVDVSTVELHASRAVTPVWLQNGLREDWPIERLKVPSRFLRLFAGATRLWTPAVHIHNAVGEADVDVELDPDPPPEAGPGEWVAPPRDVGTPRLSLRALGGLGWRS